MGRMPIPDDQNPSAAADELRCNSQKSTRFAAADDHPLSTMKKKQPSNVSPSRGMVMLLSIISPEATAFGCAIISPDNFFHPPLPAVVVWFSPPRRCGNIAGYPTHNRKAARTMIGLRGQRCRTRPPMVSLSLSVYWSAPRAAGGAVLCTAVCSGVRAADQKCLLKHVWVVPESREICAKSETDETAKTEKIPGSVNHLSISLRCTLLAAQLSQCGGRPPEWRRSSFS